MSLLENIAVFVRSVERGSFSAAGRDMRLTTAVVSHRIQTLEKHLGCRLLNRTTRQLQLTEQGRIFYEQAREIQEAVERAEASIAEAGASPSGSLKVTAPLGFGRRVVAPMVARFHAAFPRIDVRLRLADHILDLLHESIDVAVRMAPLPDSSLMVRKIADVPRVLCASPDYLERHGTPKTLSDLSQHQCLLLRFPGSPQSRWRLMVEGEAQDVPVRGPYDADDADVLTEWALAGLGITLKPTFEIAGALREGRLVPVLADTPPEPVTLAVLYPYRRMVPVKVRAFADMMVEEARHHLAAQR